jgi:hypothetical protein
MDLITLVVFCNVGLAIGCIMLTVLTVRLRRQLAAIARICDRWSNDWVGLSTVAPGAILDGRAQIRKLRRIYRQQAVAIDRLQAIGLFVQITRSVLLQRQRKSTKD